jgi:hypothetical protein
MLVRSDVVERETCRAEGLELGANLRPHLSAHMGRKNTAAPESAIFARNRPRIDQIWDRRRRQRRFGLDHSSFDPVGSAANWGIDPESKASILAKIVYRPRRHGDALGTAL